MSSQAPVEPSYEIYAHTLKEMRALLIEVKDSRNESIDWKEKAEVLEKELKALKKNKNYGLFWKNKEEVFDIQSKDSFPVLKEIYDFSIVQDDAPSNTVIEGDNYHALSILSYTHKSKIDLIYIDPPYNTGNKDFLYNDHYVDKEDDFRHSKWLSFMEKRLNLAKELLKDSGVIFISIDDNEQAQLKLLCDEIFGEENLVSELIWERIHTIKANARLFSTRHEYILCYSKNIELLDIKQLIRNEKQLGEYKNPDNDNRGPWARGNLLSPKYSAQNDYEITGTNGKVYKPRQGTSWRYKKERLEELILDKRIIFEPNSLRQKLFLSERSEGVTPETILFHDDVGHTQLGTEELKNIFDDKIFDYPKPSKLIKWIISRHTNKNLLVLDFFAGSGTTGHAVLALNNEDGGSRRFILCSNREDTLENPTKNICRDITYERVKRIAIGYTNQKGENIEGLGSSIRYLKTDFVPKQKGTDNIRHCMVERCAEMLCLRENIWGKIDDISNDAMMFYKRGDRYLAILFSLFQFEEFCKILRTFEKPISIYVFSRGQMTIEDFEGIQVSYSVEEIPDPILAVYKTIFGL